MSVQAAFSSALSDPQGEIPPEVLSYFRAWMKERFHDLVLAEFSCRKRQRPELTQAEIARRLGRRPEQVHRWLAAPGNWTLETASDLLLAISGSTVTICAEPVEMTATANHPGGPDWAADLAVAGAPAAPLPDAAPGWGGMLTQTYMEPEFHVQRNPALEYRAGAYP